MNMAYNLPVYNIPALKRAAYRRLRDLGYVWRGCSRINEFDGRVTCSIQIYTEEKYIIKSPADIVVENGDEIRGHDLQTERKKGFQGGENISRSKE